MKFTRRTFSITCLGMTLGLGSLSANAQIVESFDSGLPTAGTSAPPGENIVLPSGTWFAINRSAPIGLTGVRQGTAATVFGPHQGAGFATMNFNNGAGTATISTWLITPEISLANGKDLKFYTRSAAGTFPDRLQVRMSLAGASTNVGTAATSVGDFSTLLLDINPTYSTADFPAGYPFSAYQEFTITLSGLGGPTQGRLAFRYFVENGGPNGANSNFIGIDTVTFGDPPNECLLPLPGGCMADFVGATAGDPPNGIVGVPDLLRVINTWGQDGNPTGPRPQCDIRPLPNGDCVVGVPDLLGVINTWGPCPVITGACCLSDGSCIVATAANCASSSGTYQGDNVSCASVTCPIVPANDNCQGAINLGIGSHNITNTGATNSPQPGGSCTFGGPVNFSLDVWYTHTATCTGNLNVDVCSTTGSVTDTVLAIYSGTCPGSLTEIGCDDDACTGNTAAGDLSRATAFVNENDVVYIRVAVWGGNTPGDMVLTIGPCDTVAIDNDLCMFATALNVPGSIADNINGATGEANATPTCTPNVPMSNGRWYSVTGDGTTYTATTCNSTPFQGWDARLSVFCGVNCDNLFACAGANDDGGGACGLFSTVSWCTNPGQNYFIVVHTADDATGEGDYLLEVSSNGTPCNTAIACGPSCGPCVGTSEGLPCRVDGDIPASDPNGGCNSVPPSFGLALAVDQVVCGIGSYYTTGGSGYRDTDWYRFTPGATAQYGITACGDFPISVFFITYGNPSVTTCGATAQILGPAAFPAFTEGTSPAVTLTGGVEYAVFAAPQTGLGTLACSNYRIKVVNLGAPPVAPANDLCANAVTVLHSSSTNGTTVAATPAAGPDAQLAGMPYACHWAAAPGTIHNTVWYKFVATGTTATVNTCGSPAGLVDSIVGVFSGTCGAFTQIGCGEDECAAGAAPYLSNTGSIAGLTVGNTYFICVGQPGGWAGEVAGAFTLQVGP